MYFTNQYEGGLVLQSVLKLFEFLTYHALNSLDMLLLKVKKTNCI